MDSEPARMLSAATGRLLNTRPVMVTEADGRISVDRRCVQALTAALHRAPDGAGDRAVRAIAAGHDQATQGATFTLEGARLLARLLDESARAVTRRAQIERGMIPGALSAREALLITSRMRGVR